MDSVDSSISLLDGEGTSHDVMQFQEELDYGSHLDLEDSSRSSSPKIKLIDLGNTPHHLDGPAVDDINTDSAMMFGGDLSTSEMTAEAGFSLDNSNLLKDSVVEEVSVEEIPSVSQIPLEPLSVPQTSSKEVKLQVPVLTFQNGATIMVLDTNLFRNVEKINLGLLEETSSKEIQEQAGNTINVQEVITSALPSTNTEIAKKNKTSTASSKNAIALSSLQTQDAVVGHIVNTESGKHVKHFY